MPPTGALGSISSQEGVSRTKFAPITVTAFCDVVLPATALKPRSSTDFPVEVSTKWLFCAWIHGVTGAAAAVPGATSAMTTAASESTPTAAPSERRADVHARLNE